MCKRVAVMTGKQWFARQKKRTDCAAKHVNWTHCFLVSCGAMPSAKDNPDDFKISAIIPPRKKSEGSTRRILMLQMT